MGKLFIPIDYMGMVLLYPAHTLPISILRHQGGHTIRWHVGVRSIEKKKILPHANKQAKIYLLYCSNESIEELTLEDSKVFNESGFSWVM